MKFFHGLMFLLVSCWVSPKPAMAAADYCSTVANAAAAREYNRAYGNCLGGNAGNTGHPSCQSDWECSSDQNCVNSVCVLIPDCPATTRCDECSLGSRTCRVLDCRGNLKSSFVEQCHERNAYSCGACQQSGGGERYYYTVFLEDQPTDASRVYDGRSACGDARAADPRCQGN